MTPETTRAVDQALAKLPLDDRVVALIANIITRRPQAVPAVLSMLAVTTAMTRYLPFATRVQLAELLRDAADEVERMRQKVPIGR
jgi:hypothetical protein